MPRATLYGNVLTPRLALQSYMEAMQRFIETEIQPVLLSLLQATSLTGQPTSYGVSEPRIEGGFWVNSFTWQDSPGDTPTRLIHGLLTGANRDGIWVDYQIGDRGEGITAPFGPFGRPGRSFIELFSRSLLLSTLPQGKKRARGFWTPQGRGMFTEAPVTFQTRIRIPHD